MTTHKLYKILIPESVQISLWKQVDYISNIQNSPLVAKEWIDGIISAIESLKEFPERIAIAPENKYIKKTGKASKAVIRHLIYKKSFRIIFTIVKDEVIILSTRHGKRLTLIDNK